LLAAGCDDDGGTKATPDQDSGTSPDEDSGTPPDEDSGMPPDEDATTPPPDGGAEPGSAEVTALIGFSGQVEFPLDAAPSPDGQTTWLVAYVEGIGRVLAATEGAGAEAIDSGGSLVIPMGIATDGQTVWVADPGWANPDPEADGSPGAILALPASGGVPTPVAGTEGTQPVALDVTGDTGAATLHFVGVDSETGAPGVFSVAAAGGDPSVVHRGAPFGQPGGLAVGSEATYVADHESGILYAIGDGGVEVLLTGFAFGTPAGMALSLDGAFLLISAVDPADQTALVYRVDLAAREIAATYDIGDDGARVAAGGLHRARDLDSFMWAYPADPDDGGEVFRVATEASP